MSKLYNRDRVVISLTVYRQLYAEVSREATARGVTRGQIFDEMMAARYDKTDETSA